MVVPSIRIHVMESEFFCLNCEDTGILVNGEDCPYCDAIPTFECFGDFDSAMASAGFGTDEDYGGDHYDHDSYGDF